MKKTVSRIKQGLNFYQDIDIVADIHLEKMG